MSGLHQCPHAGCTRRITSDLFACSQHWFTLPETIRTRIHRAYRNYSRGGGTFADLTAAHAQALSFWRQT